jgi:gamma-glutamyltranspeptidase/glutathione hydrolase
MLLAPLACSAPSDRPEPTQDPDGPVISFPTVNRPDVRGTRGAVSAGHPLAAAAGYEVLRRGGNAVDAAVAMAGVLAVVRPHMNGIGGDAFALIYLADERRVVGLNGSGMAGALATPDFLQGYDQIPETGALSITVPGVVDAWARALERHGTMSLAELLQPAIRYAREGFPVSSRLHRDVQAGSARLNPDARSIYLPNGEPPAVGSMLRNPALAGTLERIAAEGASGFYQGDVARSLAGLVESEGGYLRQEDFARQSSLWVEPLVGDYLEHRFLVLPPNSQGLAQLLQMEMAKSFDFKAMGHNTSSYLHTLIEIKKLAFADRDRWVADPAFSPVPVDRLLDAAYGAERAGKVDARRAANPVSQGLDDLGDGEGDHRQDLDDSGDTVYLTAVDPYGNAVSWIQSHYQSFGSGLMDGETGVLFHNRGALFTLEEGHPNVIAPGKRPYHTLTPTLALKNGRLAFTLGTPGGDGQTQTLLQIVHNLLLFGMTPQESIEAPRYRGYSGLRVVVEDRIPADTRRELERLGHELEVIPGWTSTFGGAQMIHVGPVSGTLTAAADPRREAYAIAY